MLKQNLSVFAHPTEEISLIPLVELRDKAFITLFPMDSITDEIPPLTNGWNQEVTTASFPWKEQEAALSLAASKEIKSRCGSADFIRSKWHFHFLRKKKNNKKNSWKLAQKSFLGGRQHCLHCVYSGWLWQEKRRSAHSEPLGRHMQLMLAPKSSFELQRINHYSNVSDWTLLKFERLHLPLSAFQVQTLPMGFFFLIRWELNGKGFCS